MDENVVSEHPRQAPWDTLVDRLQAQRAVAGDPSYAAITELVTRARLSAGASEHAARVARSTVYDCFRPGRTRMNLGLVREIAAVLGADASTVESWVAEARTPAAPVVVPSEPPAPAASASTQEVVLLLVGCVAINLVGRGLVDLLHLPAFLDMVGTAVAAFALGPWLGALVGVGTNLLGVASSGPASLPFALANVAGAVVWGYGDRRFGLGRTLPRFLTLNVVVAVVCSAVSVPILLILFDGSTGNGQAVIAANIAELTHQHVLSVAVANLLVSVGDKMISGFVALVVISSLPWRLHRGAGLTVSLTPSPDPAG